MADVRHKGRIVAIAVGATALVVLSLALWLSWSHLHFWYSFQSIGCNTQGYPEYKHRQTGILFVRLPDGKFPMGAQKEDPRGANYDQMLKRKKARFTKLRSAPSSSGSMR